MIRVINKSILTGVASSIDIPMSVDDFKSCAIAWREGELIQNAFPMLNVDQREFIMTGIQPEEFPDDRKY